MSDTDPVETPEGDAPAEGDEAAAPEGDEAAEATSEDAEAAEAAPEEAAAEGIQGTVTGGE